MFPLKDSRSSRIFPVVTVILITINVLVFFAEMLSQNPDLFISRYALIPKNINLEVYSTFLPFITSLFLHAGFLHILSNMWFLKIFGDNVEEEFGAITYLIVYLLCGIAGGILQYLFSPGSDIPMLGASGAVAGILGAYLVFFPAHRIETLVPLGFFFTTVDIPASLMLVYWFVAQLFSGVGSVAVAQLGGVAFWAHVGGFISGYLIAKVSRGGGNRVSEDSVFDI